VNESSFTGEFSWIDKHFAVFTERCRKMEVWSLNGAAECFHAGGIITTLSVCESRLEKLDFV